MPEDEAQQQQSEGKSSTAEPFLGTRGWIILVVAELLTVLFLSVFFYYRDPKQNTFGGTEEGEGVGESLKYYNKYDYTMEGLNYSLQMPGGNTATMSMSIQIILGRTPDERQREVEISEEDWTKFKEAVKMMDGEIRDRLRTQISQQSVSQLSSPGGQDKIKEYVKDFVNTKLRNLQMDLSDDDLARDRVTKVLIRDLYIQQ